ncbi:transposase family protein [Streptomyces sp. NPDC059456]|uniref:transposase family protein n=1 Tax=Streptomyces sp. NPDC059456 TaxID=3346838 RepID=UPI00367A43DF
MRYCSCGCRTGLTSRCGTAPTTTAVRTSASRLRCTRAVEPAKGSNSTRAATGRNPLPRQVGASPLVPRPRPMRTRRGGPLFADRAYTGTGSWVTTGLKRPPGGELTLTQRTVNRALAAARTPVERGMARLKSWQIFRRSRISPNRLTVIT